MINDKSLCDDQPLLQMLRSECESIDSAELLDHVETCEHCQQRLDELVANESEWQKTVEFLSGSANESATNGTDRFDASLHKDRVQLRQPGWTESMARQLLSPASHPEMLGRIGRYDVERLIGSGGMGVVFKAHDTELNRPVAVKLLAPYLSGSGSARNRFAREARAAAAVVDEHVVAIHNVESDSEHPFLVMKYIAGGSLQLRLDREGPLEVCEILRIGMQTAKGLAAAHAQGLIHRDVKPSNILLDEGVERALLTDFGLARATDDASLTRSGFHPGTPHYMSPEQVRGEAIDARSDLFGLGCVLYAMCTGHPPFRSETSYSVLRRITDDTPRSIRETNPDIPEWLEQVVMKLLAKSAADRFESAEQVAEILEECLAHVQQPTTTPMPESIAALAPRRVKERTWMKYLAAAALSFSLLFAGVLIVLELNKGTLTIESEADGIPIRIMQGDKIVDKMIVTKGELSTRINAGKYVVEIDGGFDGILVQDKEVSLKRGEDTTVRIVRASTTDGASRSRNASQMVQDARQSALLAYQKAIGLGRSASSDEADTDVGRQTDADELPNDAVSGRTDTAARSETQTAVKKHAIELLLQTHADLLKRREDAEAELKRMAQEEPVNQQKLSMSLARLTRLNALLTELCNKLFEFGVPAIAGSMEVSLERAGRPAHGSFSVPGPPTADLELQLPSGVEDIVINAEPVPARTVLWNIAGAVFVPVTADELKSPIAFWEGSGGLRVTHLREHGPAEDAMLQVDDIILAIDSKPVESIEAINRAWNLTDYDAPVSVRFLRGKRTGSVRLKWDARHMGNSALARGKVLRREKDNVAVSLGTEDGVYPGDRLEAGTIPMGVMEVITASANQSVAKVVSEHKQLPVKTGDPVSYGRLKLLTPPNSKSAGLPISSTPNEPKESAMHAPLTIAGPTDNAKQATQALAKLKAESEKLSNAYGKALDEAADEVERQHVRAEMDPREIMPRKYLALEAKYRGSEAALQALVEICGMAASVGDPASECATGRVEAVKRVINHYHQQKGVEEVINSLDGGSFVPQANELLQGLVEKSPYVKIQAKALIAQIVRRRDALLLERELGQAQEYLERGIVPASPMQAEVAERYKRIKNTDFKQLRIDINEKLKRLAERYAQVPVEIYGTGAIAAQRLSHAVNKVVIGSEAPELVATDLDGKRFRLSDLRGKTVVLLFANSSNDNYAKMYAPMRQLAARYRHASVKVVAIMSNTDRTHIEAAAQRGDLPWTVIPEPLNGPLQLDWGIKTYPVVYVVDREGTLQPPLHMSYYGDGGYDTEDVRDTLDKLLGLEKLPEAKSGFIDPIGAAAAEHKPEADRSLPITKNREDTAEVSVAPMKFDTLEDFLKPGRALFDKQMQEIDARLESADEGTAEHKLFTTKKAQLQEQWDLSIAHVKGMIAAAEAGNPVKLAPIVIPNNPTPWQAPLPDPLQGHDEEIASVLAGTWNFSKLSGFEEDITGVTATFSKNMVVVKVRFEDETNNEQFEELQYMYRIFGNKIDLWDYNPDKHETDRTHPMLGSFSLKGNTLCICHHGREMAVGQPQARPPVHPGKGFVYWELERMTDKRPPNVEADRTHH